MTLTLPAIDPDNGYEFTTKPRVLANTYGDGYTQTAPDGINTMMRQTTLTWTNIPTSDKNTLISFFRSTFGVSFFYWTPDEETSPSLWRVTNWHERHAMHGVYVVKASIEEEPDLS